MYQLPRRPKAFATHPHPSTITHFRGPCDLDQEPQPCQASHPTPTQNTHWRLQDQNTCNQHEDKLTQQLSEDRSRQLLEAYQDQTRGESRIPPAVSALQRNQKTTAKALLPLLFVGITKSTPANSLSVLHNATIGMPTLDASLTA